MGGRLGRLGGRSLRRSWGWGSDGGVDGRSWWLLGWCGCSRVSYADGLRLRMESWIWIVVGEIDDAWKSDLSLASVSVSVFDGVD